EEKGADAKHGDAKPDDAKSGNAKSEDNKSAGEGPEPGSTAENPPKPVRIDFDKIVQRTVALPISARSINGLQSGKAGLVYIVESSRGGLFGGPGGTLSKFDLKTRNLEKLADEVTGFDLSGNGEKMLLRIVHTRDNAAPPPPQPEYVIASATAPLK